MRLCKRGKRYLIQLHNRLTTICLYPLSSYVETGPVIFLKCFDWSTTVFKVQRPEWIKQMIYECLVAPVSWFVVHSCRRRSLVYYLLSSRVKSPAGYGWSRKMFTCQVTFSFSVFQITTPLSGKNRMTGTCTMNLNYVKYIRTISTHLVCTEDSYWRLY